MSITTVTLTIPGLTNIVITVTASSTVREIEQQIGSLYWIGLEVDGTFVPLVQWKHLVSNREMRTALNEAMKQVKAAIASLQPEPPMPAVAAKLPIYNKEIVYDRETHDYAMYLDGELVGFARTYHEAEVTLDQLIFELISGQYFREAA